VVASLPAGNCSGLFRADIVVYPTLAVVVVCGHEAVSATLSTDQDADTFDQQLGNQSVRPKENKPQTPGLGPCDLCNYPSLRHELLLCDAGASPAITTLLGKARLERLVLSEFRCEQALLWHPAFLSIGGKVCDCAG
jgi:hypothetical protein